MIDFIFVVEDPIQWHTDNLARHPNHYSFLKYLGAEFICTVQESFGAKVYYNTLVKQNERVSIAANLFFIMLINAIFYYSAAIALYLTLNLFPRR